MHVHVLVIGVGVGMVVVIALAWWQLMRVIKSDGGDPRAELSSKAPFKAWSSNRQHEREAHAAEGIDQSKDRDVSRSWGN